MTQTYFKSEERSTQELEARLRVSRAWETARETLNKFYSESEKGSGKYRLYSEK